jgi:hypothetical protein
MPGIKLCDQMGNNSADRHRLVATMGLAVPFRPEKEGEVKSFRVLLENTWMYARLT